MGIHREFTRSILSITSTEASIEYLALKPIRKPQESKLPSRLRVNFSALGFDSADVIVGVGVVLTFRQFSSSFVTTTDRSDAFNGASVDG